MENTLFWPNISKYCTKFTSTCVNCQKYKKPKTKYGHLTVKTVEVTPSRVLCMDLIGPSMITLPYKKVMVLNSVTFIDPATSWFKIAAINSNSSLEIVTKLKNLWLSRYPNPTSIIIDNGM